MVEAAGEEEEVVEVVEEGKEEEADAAPDQLHVDPARSYVSPFGAVPYSIVSITSPLGAVSLRVSFLLLSTIDVSARGSLSDVLAATTSDSLKVNFLFDASSIIHEIKSTCSFPKFSISIYSSSSSDPVVFGYRVVKRREVGEEEVVEVDEVVEVVEVEGEEEEEDEEEDEDGVEVVVGVVSAPSVVCGADVVPDQFQVEPVRS